MPVYAREWEKPMKRHRRCRFCLRRPRRKPAAESSARQISNGAACIKHYTCARVHKCTMYRRCILYKLKTLNQRIKHSKPRLVAYSIFIYYYDYSLFFAPTNSFHALCTPFNYLLYNITLIFSTRYYFIMS